MIMDALNVFYKFIFISISLCVSVETLKTLTFRQHLSRYNKQEMFDILLLHLSSFYDFVIIHMSQVKHHNCQAPRSRSSYIS